MAPRKPKVQPPAPPRRTLVLDNGAFTIKAGFVSHGDDDDENGGKDSDGAADGQPRIIPNCIARDRDRKTYVGSELERCKDFGEILFRRPVEKGFIVNWEAQREIWEREFFDAKAPQRCDPSETRLLLAEHPNSLPVLQTNCDQMVFEEFGFASYYRGNGPSFNAYHDVQGIFRTPRDADAPAPQIPAEAILLIDSGYSHTTVSPLLNGRPLHPAVRRLDVGGKLLTNYLTRLLSLRHYDMRNDTHIVNEMKEAACFVSLDFARDLDAAWKGPRGTRNPTYLAGGPGALAKDYVLPDFHTRMAGVVRDHNPVTTTRQQQQLLGEASEDVLTLRNERFAPPELLFHPADVGLRQQPGLADLAMQSLRALPVGLWPALLANVVVVGGNSLFPGFVQRLQQEIVQRAPDDCVVRVARPANPVTSTWQGGARLARHPHMGNLAVTKQEYDEYGSAWLARKFAGLET